MGKKIYTFEKFVNESYSVNEGILSWIKSQVIDKLTGWSKSFYENIKSDKIRKIESGPMKDKPIAMLFLPQNGPIDQQMKEYYGRNHLKESLEEIEEAATPLEWTGEGGVRNIGIEKYKDELIFLYESQVAKLRAKPLFVFGAPGIGKTQIVGQVASELGAMVQALELRYYTPTDFKGVPEVIEIEEPVFKKDPETGRTMLVYPGKRVTVDNPPLILPQDNGVNGKGGILFLDEFNRAPAKVQSSLMQFVQTRKIDTYELPDKWIIVAAGNRPEDSDDVSEPDPALADRFTIFNYVPDVENFGKFLASKKWSIAPAVVSFLKNNPKWFHNMDRDVKLLNYPTPRSWADATEILDNKIYLSKGKYSSWMDFPIDEIQDIFHDQIGDLAAASFVQYLKIIKNFTEEELDLIFDDPDSAPVQKLKDLKKELTYSFLSFMLSKVEKYSTEKLYNLMKFYSRAKEAEILSWLLKRIQDKYPEFQGTPSDSDKEAEMKDEARGMVTSALSSQGIR